MEIVKLNDIDLSNLEKSRFQGSTSTIYKNNDTCIKMLDKLFPEEKEIIYRKFLAMDGIKLDDVLLPKVLILKDDKLVGYTMDNFKDSMPLLDYFGRSRHVNCKDIFTAVKKASLILRDIHSSGIICQDLTFDNILIDNSGNIKYCDIDSCCYNGYMNNFISVLLNRFLFDYRKEDGCKLSINIDRISFLLSFCLLVYNSELSMVYKSKYNRMLTDNVETLKNIKEYINVLNDKSKALIEVPYMDEVICDSDDYIIDREKQLSLKQKILRKL